MYLFINTSKPSELDVFLIKENKILSKLCVKGDYKLSEKLLVTIDKLLNKNKVKLKNLKAIITVTGPGPFTSLRIAVSVANALTYSLKIPNIGIKIRGDLTNWQLIKRSFKELNKKTNQKIILPFYDKEPNIT